MANGREHALATLSAATCFAVNAVTNGSPPEYVAGAFLGLLLSPDLDVDAGNVSYSLVGGLRRAWAWYWMPYAVIMPHRSKRSHIPVVSTLIRMAYFPWPFIAAYYLGLDLGAITVGLMAVDTIHFLMDLRVFSWIWRLR